SAGPTRPCPVSPWHCLQLAAKVEAPRWARTSVWLSRASCWRVGSKRVMAPSVISSRKISPTMMLICLLVFILFERPRVHGVLRVVVGTARDDLAGVHRDAVGVDLRDLKG